MLLYDFATVRSLLLRSFLLLVGASAGHAQSDEAASAHLQLEKSSTELTITGIVSSSAHEDILRRTAATLYPDLPLIVTVNDRVLAPPGWSLVTDLTLRALLPTTSAIATITASRITIKGQTRDIQDYSESVNRVRRALIPEMTLIDSVQDVSRSMSLRDDCLSAFGGVSATGNVFFAPDSSVVSSAAYAFLDEIVQVASDCPDAKIMITGHTDNMGDDRINQQISEARANSVSDYMTRRGLSPRRVSARGVGASDPLVKENSQRARARNRRIELQLVFTNPN